MDKANLSTLLNVYYGQTNRLAKAINMEESIILSVFSEPELDLIHNQVKSLLSDNSKLEINHKDFNLVLAFHHKQLPLEVNEETSKKIFERIALDNDEIVKFLKQNDSIVNKKSISLLEFKTMEQKILVYSYLMNNVCKEHLRKHKVSAEWDLAINDYSNRLNKKIEVFNQSYVMQYSSFLDCYEIFDYNSFRYQVPSKSLYKVIKDITQETKDSFELYLYYLAVNGSGDKEKLKRFWAFNFFLNDLEAKKITKK